MKKYQPSKLKGHNRSSKTRCQLEVSSPQRKRPPALSLSHQRSKGRQQKMRHLTRSSRPHSTKTFTVWHLLIRVQAPMCRAQESQVRAAVPIHIREEAQKQAKIFYAEQNKLVSTACPQRFHKYYAERCSQRLRF